MKHDAAGQEAVVRLLTEQYQRIRPIEEEWGIRLREDDLRPRIEHFHDAVRALLAGGGDPYIKGGRLSVEYLAYDLAQLRVIQEKPIGRINRMTQKSVSGELVPLGVGGRTSPDSKVRMELSALYVFYTLLYSALFARTAEDGFQVRSEQAETQADDLARIEQILKALVKGQITAREAEEEFMHVDRDDLREAMQGMVRKGKLSPADMMKAQGMVSTIRQGLAANKKSAEQAHLSYVTAQLAVFEASQDAVKTMARQGLNLAGQFLEAATRGAGQGRRR